MKREEKYKRYVRLEDLLSYTGLGRVSAERIATASKARIKLGKSKTSWVIYDLKMIDTYLNK